MSAILTAPPRVDIPKIDTPKIDTPKKQTRASKKTTSRGHIVPLPVFHAPVLNTPILDTLVPDNTLSDNGLSDAHLTNNSPDSLPDHYLDHYMETWRASLPTFPWEDGYRIVTDPVTGETHEVQLTLFDMLYESEDDIGAVFMSQGADHSTLAGLLAVMLQAYRTGWLFLSDVYVRWPILGIRPKGPDVIAVPGGRMPPKGQKSFVVGRDGPIPAFVIEITSESSRENDLITKKNFYASMGVREYLIIDLWPEEGDAWQLIGYRLEGEPHYTRLTPDAEGGITIETLGLRFVAVGNSHIHVFDQATGERLLTQAEVMALAESEAQARVEAEARADTEAQGRAKAEQQAEQERQKNERYEAYLRSLGIDPERI